MKKSNSLVPPMTIGLAIFLRKTTLASPIDVENIRQYDFNQNIPRGGGESFALDTALSWGMYILLILCICVLAYFTTRWLAKYQRNKSLKSKYMQVLDVLILDNENKIYILRAPQGIIMVGATPRGISLLENFESEEVEFIEEVESGISVPKFAAHLERFLTNKDFLSEAEEKSGDNHE